MTTFFISRHPGALEWAQRRQITFDRHEEHLDISLVHPGDTVIGTLPINLAAEVCRKGAAYRHLALKLAASDRGKELTADDLDRCEATLTSYIVKETL